MFVATITLAMGESIQQVNHEILVKKQRKRKAQIARKTSKAGKDQEREEDELEIIYQETIKVKNKTAMRSVALINSDRLLKATLLAFFTGKEATFIKESERTALRRKIVCAGEYAETIHGKKWFKAAMFTAVLCSGVVVLLGTYKEIKGNSAMVPLQHWIEAIAIFAFVFEFFVTLARFKTAPWGYFCHPHNCFDFVVLLGSMRVLPGGAEFWSLMRLMRLLLVLKLAPSKKQSLRIAVGTLMRGSVSISYIFVLLLATYFLFGNIAHLLFAANDPWHFGNLHTCMITLFRVSLLDNWIQIMFVFVKSDL
jgi:hypothetical protein